MFLNLIESNKFRPFSQVCPKSVWGMLETVEWSTIDSFKEKRLHPKVKSYITYQTMQYDPTLKLFLFFKGIKFIPKVQFFWPPDIYELSSMFDLCCPDWPLHSHCSPHAQLPNIAAQPLRLASEACRCMLIATRVVRRAKAAWVYVRFYSLWTTAPPPTMLFPQPPLPLIWDMLGLVITEQMNLLTPKLDLWDGDISDVRQCFTHVHVCLLSLNYSASSSVENQFYPEEGLSWIPAPRASDIHCTLSALAQYLHFSKQKKYEKEFFSFPFIIKVNWAPLQQKVH